MLLNTFNKMTNLPLILSVLCLVQERSVLLDINKTNMKIKCSELKAMFCLLM